MQVTKPHAPHTEVVSTASSSIQSVSLDSPETSPETSAEELAVDAWNPYLTSHIICIHAEQSTPDYLAEPLLPIDPVDDSLKALDNMHLVHAQKVETFWQKLAWVCFSCSQPSLLQIKREMFVAVYSFLSGSGALALTVVYLTEFSVHACRRCMTQT